MTEERLREIEDGLVGVGPDLRDLDDVIESLIAEVRRLRNDLAVADGDGGQRQDEVARLRATIDRIKALGKTGSHSVGIKWLLDVCEDKP